MDERKRAQDVPGGPGGSDPGQVPGQERYGEPEVGETPKLDPDAVQQAPPPAEDKEKGIGGREVGDQPTQQ
jgi:hypothetical protein